MGILKMALPHCQLHVDSTEMLYVHGAATTVGEAVAEYYSFDRDVYLLCKGWRRR